MWSVMGAATLASFLRLADGRLRGCEQSEGGSVQPHRLRVCSTQTAATVAPVSLTAVSAFHVALAVLVVALWEVTDVW